MKGFSICDVSIEMLALESYDYSCFQISEEVRCINAPRQFAPDQLGNVVLVESTTRGERLEREEIRVLLESLTTTFSNLVMDTSDGLGLPTYMQNAVDAKTQKISILMDYSAMSSAWYSSLLNWALHTEKVDEILIDCVYSVSKHREKFPPLRIEDITALPGCYGHGRIRGETVVIVGLGFDNIAIRAALERMQPKTLYSHISESEFHPDYRKRAYDLNRPIVDRSDTVLYLPLTSVELAFSYLSRLASPHISSGITSFLPMGPKPHILAAVLVALRYPSITCLHVRGGRDESEAVGSLGAVVATRLLFTKNGKAASG